MASIQKDKRIEELEKELRKEKEANKQKDARICRRDERISQLKQKLQHSQGMNV